MSLRRQILGGALVLPFLSWETPSQQTLLGMRKTDPPGELALRLWVGKGEGARPRLGCAGVGTSGLWEPLPFGGTRYFLASFIFYHSYLWE